MIISLSLPFFLYKICRATIGLSSVSHLMELPAPIGVKPVALLELTESLPAMLRHLFMHSFKPFFVILHLVEMLIYHLNEILLT